MMGFNGVLAVLRWMSHTIQGTQIHTHTQTHRKRGDGGGEGGGEDEWRATIITIGRIENVIQLICANHPIQSFACATIEIRTDRNLSSTKPQCGAINVIHELINKNNYQKTKEFRVDFWHKTENENKFFFFFIFLDFRQIGRFVVPKLEKCVPMQFSKSNFTITSEKAFASKHTNSDWQMFH